MSKEELIDKMVTAVMEDFDFDRVHRVMTNLDWKWDIGDGEMIVPSSYRLTKQAERLLREVAQHYGDKECYLCGSGGFMAHLDGETLSLQFILTETTSYASDFINIDEPDLEAKRTEVLKAYGNAIVPQVMYEIFRAIEIVEQREQILHSLLKKYYGTETNQNPLSTIENKMV